MRLLLADLFASSAKNDDKIRILTGDHGYFLFDKIRQDSPRQFLNVGIIEQAEIGIAAGLAKIGFKPIVYGLSSFIPMRCLEQIKLDICYPNLPVIIIGDGAGLVYSSMGASHHCAEDIAVLRCMPNMTIYSPCDKEELKICWEQALMNKGPTYIRVGRCDLPEAELVDWYGFRADYSGTRNTVLAATGSMVLKAKAIGEKHNLGVLSIYQIKPIPLFVLGFLDVEQIIVMEEHSQRGGLFSMLCEELSQHDIKIHSIALEDKFADKSGSWQYALSEHEMDDENLEKRIVKILG